MELIRLEAKEIIRITENDKILAYKISRTEDGSLILEIKVDIGTSLLEISDITEETSQG